MTMTASGLRTCVVICYWSGEPKKSLFRLLAQMQRMDAGVPFGLVIVVNGGDKAPLVLPDRYASLNAKVINRVNHGYNIEGWDVGWRSSLEFDYYLFLQTDCFLKKKNWVADFEFRMSEDPGVGLIGEFYSWEEQSWQYIRSCTDRDLGANAGQRESGEHPIDIIQANFRKRGLPLTELGSHIPTVICYTSRQILNEIGGFPLFSNPTYWDAVTAEVAFSRLVEARGYRLTRVRSEDFFVIGHRQYTTFNKITKQMRGVLRKLFN